MNVHETLILRIFKLCTLQDLYNFIIVNVMIAMSSNHPTVGYRPKNMLSLLPRALSYTPKANLVLSIFIHSI
jgi:hypothetical protein